MSLKEAPRNQRDSPWFQDIVILLTLVAFATAQTAYDILASNPEFLAARRVTNAQLLIVIVAFGLLPAIILGLPWTWCRRIHPRLHRGMFGVLVLVFSLAVFWQLYNTYLSDAKGLLRIPWLWVVPSAALAWWASVRERDFRSFLLALSPAILLFPALFLYRAWRSPIPPPPLETSAQASTQPAPAPNGTPVFLVVFDELGLQILLDEKGNIDRQQFPNFARLAAESHWFRNATSNSAKTISSIAAMVTGNFPHATNSTHAFYPNTVFSLLAPTYDVYIEEVGYTDFCDSDAFFCLNDATGDGTAGLLRDLGYLVADRLLPAKLTSTCPIPRTPGDRFKASRSGRGRRWPVAAACCTPSTLWAKPMSCSLRTSFCRIRPTR
jgi:hypothetical protein